jgi:hypothetical protein
VIERAKDACKNSNEDVDYHFVDYHEEITHGKGAKQDYPSVKLSHYACYLIVQNADPGKEVVALGNMKMSRSDKVSLAVGFNPRNLARSIMSRQRQLNNNYNVGSIVAKRRKHAFTFPWVETHG